MNSENLVYYLIYSHSIPVRERENTKRKIGEAGDFRSLPSSHSLSGAEVQLVSPDHRCDFLLIN